jgi:hypothetical protein
MVEQINAFWTVVIVNNHWVVAYGSPSAIPYCDMPIDTPWPIDFDGSVSSVSNFSTCSTLSAIPIRP